jgi:poly(3-hydroxybutyrate) depolymerase
MLLAPLLAVLSATIAAAASSGCDATKPPVERNKRHNVTLAGSKRTYMYFLPADYHAAAPNPLILSFHGAGRTSDWQADLDALTDPFFNRDHVVAYPQALQYGASPNFTYWQGAPNATADDVAYVGAVLDDLAATLCLDPARVFATGKSQGGGMVGRLACDGSGVGARIAAFAPVSAAFYTGGGEAGCVGATTAVAALATECKPSRAAIPLLDFHGGNDTTIAILGGPRNGGCLPDVRAVCILHIDTDIPKSYFSTCAGQCLRARPS